MCAAELSILPHAVLKINKKLSAFWQNVHLHETMKNKVSVGKGEEKKLQCWKEGGLQRGVHLHRTTKGKLLEEKGRYMVSIWWVHLHYRTMYKISAELLVMFPPPTPSQPPSHPHRPNQSTGWTELSWTVLNFWQNDWDLLHATAVTQGSNGHRKRVSTQSRLWRRQFSRRSSRDLNSQPFDLVSTSYPRK